MNWKIYRNILYEVIMFCGQHRKIISDRCRWFPTNTQNQHTHTVVVFPPQHTHTLLPLVSLMHVCCFVACFRSNFERINFLLLVKLNFFLLFCRPHIIFVVVCLKKLERVETRTKKTIVIVHAMVIIVIVVFFFLNRSSVCSYNIGPTLLLLT